MNQAGVVPSGPSPTFELEELRIGPLGSGHAIPAWLSFITHSSTASLKDLTVSLEPYKGPPVDLTPFLRLEHLTLVGNPFLADPSHLLFTILQPLSISRLHIKHIVTLPAFLPSLPSTLVSVALPFAPASAVVAMLSGAQHALLQSLSVTSLSTWSFWSPSELIEVAVAYERRGMKLLMPEPPSDEERLEDEQQRDEVRRRRWDEVWRRV